MARLTGSSAVLLVADIERSVEYYRDRLGFTCEVHGEPPDFIVAKRDEVIILMALCEEPERIVPNWRIVSTVWNVFIRVDDVERSTRKSSAAERRSTTRSTTPPAAFASSACRTPTSTTSPSASRSRTARDGRREQE